MHCVLESVVVCGLKSVCVLFVCESAWRVGRKWRDVCALVWALLSDIVLCAGGETNFSGAGRNVKQCEPRYVSLCNFSKINSRTLWRAEVSELFCKFQDVVQSCNHIIKSYLNIIDAELKIVSIIE